MRSTLLISPSLSTLSDQQPVLINDRFKTDTTLTVITERPYWKPKSKKLRSIHLRISAEGNLANLSPACLSANNLHQRAFETTKSLQLNTNHFDYSFFPHSSMYQPFLTFSCAFLLSLAYDYGNYRKPKRSLTEQSGGEVQTDSACLCKRLQRKSLMT